MEWRLMNQAVRLAAEGGTIEIEAPARTDFFTDMATGRRTANAPFYHAQVSGDFVLRCTVSPRHRTTYDAGALVVYGDPDRWVKLAFERTDLGDNAAVSVVTDGLSDDANGEVVRGESLHLQVVRSGDMWSLHHSPDGRSWRMVRYFPLRLGRLVEAGLVAQSPVGDGCAVRFTGVEIGPNPYRSIRKPE